MCYETVTQNAPRWRPQLGRPSLVHRQQRLAACTTCEHQAPNIYTTTFTYQNVVNITSQVSKTIYTPRELPSVLWRRWLGVGKSTESVKMSDDVLAWLWLSVWNGCKWFAYRLYATVTPSYLVLQAYRGCPRKETIAYHMRKEGNHVTHGCQQEVGVWRQ